MNYLFGAMIAVFTSLALITPMVEQTPLVLSTTKRIALITMDADLSCAHNVNTVTPWGVVQYDTAGFFNPAQPTKFTIPAGVGMVEIGCSVVWQQNVSGMRQAVILKNGAFFQGGYVETQPANHRTTADFSGWTPPIPVEEGDVFEVFVAQTSGANLTLYKSTGTWFAIKEFE